jgi:hypothetical protein
VRAFPRAICTGLYAWLQCCMQLSLSRWSNMIILQQACWGVRKPEHHGWGYKLHSIASLSCTYFWPTRGIQATSCHDGISELSTHLRF